MTLRRISYRGETFISVEEAASCYAIEVHQLEQWVEEELLDPPASVEGLRAIRERDLDRVALLIRYTRLLGCDPATVRALLDLGLLE